MAATNKILVFSAAVRDFHENEELVCLFEANKLFDMFAVQTCRKDCENTVISPRSPLFQGGLEIACEVTVNTPASIKGHLLMQRYEKMVHELYCKPKNETIMDSFIDNINVDFDIQPKKKKKKRHWKYCSKTQRKHRHSIFLPKKIMSKRCI